MPEREQYDKFDFLYGLGSCVGAVLLAGYAVAKYELTGGALYFAVGVMIFFVYLGVKVVREWPQRRPE